MCALLNAPAEKEMGVVRGRQVAGEKQWAVVPTWRGGASPGGEGAGPIVPPLQVAGAVPGWRCSHVVLLPTFYQSWVCSCLLIF